MTRKPWSKFYWADWRSDPRLRMCTLAARGLWMEMLALMNEAEPIGYLLVNGVAPTDAQLAVLAGAPIDQLPDLLAELESTGVFSRTQKGVIYSRRMTRDEKRARHARKIGATGGNPTLSKKRENPRQDNPGDKGGVNTQRPEARGQRPEEASQQAPTPSSASPAALSVAVGEEVCRLAGLDAVRDLSPVRVWLERGADPERHIYPTVRAVMERRKGKPPGSLSYFNNAVTDAVETGGKRPNGAAKREPWETIAEDAIRRYGPNPGRLAE